jgi:dTDP-4-dehydrorhamnose 3,5-epimerase
MVHSMIFPEIKIIKNDSFKDDRGELWSLWESKTFPYDLNFNHDKVSTGKKNVLRGLHCDQKSWKLISCLYGEFKLVIVDFRKDSQTYLKHDSIILSLENKISVLVPPMFANGHLVLSDFTIFHYKWSYTGDYPDVRDQFSLNWADPALNIDWEIDNPILSTRDKNSKFICL